MNDTPDPAAPTGAPNGGEPAGDQPQPEAQPMTIEAQYIKDLSFENPTAPRGLALQGNPDINIDVNTTAAGLGGNAYEVVLGLRGEAKVEDQPLFIVELSYGGVFTLNNVPEESIKPVLLIEAARHLFPFARNILANATRDGGFPPLLINPIDFVQLYRQQHMTAEESALPEGANDGE